jgi:chromosome partitioning protein
MRRNTKIILCTYDKGGVGKTTLAVHIAGVLRMQQQGQTLLVDCDSRPDSWSFYQQRRPQSRERRRTIDRYLDILWNPPQVSIPKFAPIKRGDLEAYDYIAIDTDSPPEDTVSMISNNLPNVILVPINLSQKYSLRDLPMFLDTAADIEKRANREPGANYFPKFIIVPLGISERDIYTTLEKSTIRPQNCIVAPAMANLQEEINNALAENKYIWNHSGCGETYQYFQDLLNLCL